MQPRNALSALVMLATSMQAQPGVYAVLLGSGVSTGAGIPTGWGVVRDLVKKLAVAESPTDSASQSAAQTDPEAWWANRYETALGYSTLLETLGKTPAARQGLLAGYFEPSPDDDEGLKTPSKAHLALAQLVKAGFVRVIVTTNFDRLTERALEAVGISPQVIDSPHQVAGMQPLVHARVTIIKLHGDYLDLGTRNTAEELQEYPPEWRALLERIFDEYGLVVSGWSADWDTALVAALEASTNRRYPLYWDSRSSGGANAQQLLALRRGQVIEAASADELFVGLLDSVEALARMAEPPLTTAIAVDRLKRYLLNPARRIDLHDLVMNRVGLVTEATNEQVASLLHTSDQAFDERLGELAEAVGPLLELLVEGVRHDIEGTHDQLWVEVLQTLVDLHRVPSGQSFNTEAVQAQLYPALLALSAMGLAAIRYRRADLLDRLLRDVTVRKLFGDATRSSALDALYAELVLSPHVVERLPRWHGARPLYPASHLLRADLARVAASMRLDDDAYSDLVDDLEYRVGLVQWLVGEHRMPCAGEFIGRYRWIPGEGPVAERRFREQLERGGGWPWGAADPEATVNETLIPYREILQARQHYG